MARVSKDSTQPAEQGLPQDERNAQGREEPAPPRRRRPARAVLAVVVTTAVIAGVGAALRAWPPSETTGHDDDGGKPRSTAEVERTSLASGLRLNGKLGHGPATEVIAQGQGTFTKVPRTGDRIDVGEVLYELDARPVVLFTGSRPLWRELAKGMSDGPDVKQLERNLTDLGFADSANLTVDEKFTDATQAAVKRWQKALGLPQSGKVELGRVAVLPHKTVRIDQVAARLGGTSAAGAGVKVFTVTTTDVYVTVELRDDQVAQLPPGGAVSVELAAGGTMKGKVRAITPGSGGADGDGSDDSGGEGNGGAKSSATIELDRQKEAAAALKDSRPGATVTVPDRKVKDALVVPVTALVALADGGYALQVLRGGKTEPVLVPVEVGLIVDARAQVTGAVRQGEQVVVPA